METIAVDGLTIAFRRAGVGPPLVLLHGALSDSRTWRAQAGLAGDFTMVAWDAPGCGQSSDPSETFRLPEYADCLATFVKKLDLGRPHVVGLSFGAGLALEFYRRHPRVPASLILASAYAGWAGSLPPEEVQERVSRALAQAEQPSEKWVRSYLPGLFTDEASPEVIDDAVRMMLDTRRAGMVPMVRAFAEADLRDVLPEITVPTLLLYGGADRRAPVSIAEDLHARIRTSKLVVMPHIGHESNVEAPHVFNAHIRRFLRNVVGDERASPSDIG